MHELLSLSLVELTDCIQARKVSPVDVMQALRLTGISKSYGSVRALDNLSFDVAEGRFFVISEITHVSSRYLTA
jgi:hypothetical protein